MFSFFNVKTTRMIIISFFKYVPSCSYIHFRVYIFIAVIYVLINFSLVNHALLLTFSLMGTDFFVPTITTRRGNAWIVPSFFLIKYANQSPYIRHTAVTKFTLFLLNILHNLVFLGKFCSNRLKNILPILVLTDRLNGGLNHIIFLCLFVHLFWVSVLLFKSIYSSLSLWPLLDRACS